MRTTRKRMHGRRRRRSPICSKSPIQAAMNEDLNEMQDLGTEDTYGKSSNYSDMMMSARQAAAARRKQKRRVASSEYYRRMA